MLASWSWIRPVERVDREAAEDDRVGGADAGAGEHRDRRLGDHRHVDGDPVARLHPEREQRVGRLADLAVQVGVGDRAGVARLALPVDGDPVAAGRPRRGGPGSCTATLSSPPTNHLANGGLDQSSTWSHGLCQCSRSACCSQKPSRSAPAAAYASAVDVGLRPRARPAAGTVRVSCSRLASVSLTPARSLPRSRLGAVRWGVPASCSRLSGAG